MNVHREVLATYLKDGWVEVGEKWGLVEIEHPEDTCIRKMRDGYCRLDKGHRGRCTTVAFYCDSCGRMRRGSPVAHIYDDNGDPSTDHCFMCSRGLVISGDSGDSGNSGNSLDSQIAQAAPN